MFCVWRTAKAVAVFISAPQLLDNTCCQPIKEVRGSQHNRYFKLFHYFTNYALIKYFEWAKNPQKGTKDVNSKDHLSKKKC